MALLAFFGLWETTLLAGATAVSVPVLIHLLNRRRYRVVTWAAMRFLLLAQKQNSRRMRLEQLMLLLCRMALVACIVLAMASVTGWAENVWAFFWPDAAGVVKVRTARVHHIIVVDGSLSMNQGNDDSAFDRARQLAVRKIREAPSGDGFSILLMKEHPKWILGETSLDRAKAARELEALTPTHGNASLPSVLSMLNNKLSDNQKRFPGQTVYFFTDMQKASWTIPESAREGSREVLADIAKQAKLVFVDVGHDDVSNHAVVDLRIEDAFVIKDKPARIKATLKNYGPQRKEKLKVALWVGRARDGINDKPLEMKSVSQMITDIGPNGTVDISDMKYSFPKAGTYAVQVRVDDDSLAADNVRTLVVTVKDKISVLLVNGKEAANPIERSAFFALYALDPSRNDPILRTEWRRALEFSSMADNELLGYDAIFMCDVGNVGDPERTRLKKFLRQGGGVVISLGPQAWQGRAKYNEYLYENGLGLLPGSLSDILQDGDFLFDTELSNFNVRPLKAFEGADDKTALNNSRFQKYVVVELPAGSVARSILRFQREERPQKAGDSVKLTATGHSALLEYYPPLPRMDLGDPRIRDAQKEALKNAPQNYRGNVLLFPSAFSTEWGSWPASPSFLPMMQELLRLAVSGKLRGNSYSVGQILEEYIPTEGQDVDVELTTLRTKSQGGDGDSKPIKIRTQAQGDVSVFRWTDTDRSGIYVMLNTRDFTEKLFAVNCPAGTAEQNDSESDLSRLSESELKKYYPKWDLQVVTDPKMAVIPAPEPRGDGEDYVEQLSPIGPNIAHGLLFAALALLLLEVVLAWRFGRHTKVAGATAPPAVGLAAPFSVACVLAVVLAGLAFICIHTYRTGDFLSFLPNDWRARYERSLDVPPPPAGEGTFWAVSSRSDLFGVGDDFWPSLGIALAGLALIAYSYHADGPQVGTPYKALLAGLRIFLLMFVLYILLPQFKFSFDRQSPPDVVLLLDDSLSMGEPDNFSDEKVRKRAEQLGEMVRKNVKETVPGRIVLVEKELSSLKSKYDGATDPRTKQDLEIEMKYLTNRRDSFVSQLDKAMSPGPFSPSRLQLVQALLAQTDQPDHPGQDWFDYLIKTKGTKLHVYHLDASGRAIKVMSAHGTPLGELTEGDPQQIDAARLAVAQLEAEAGESRLGTAVRQVIDHFRGGSAAVIMFTDGITTGRNETIKDVAEYAASRSVPLFFVGIGDDHEVRDLYLDELKVEDYVRVNDILNFQAKLGGKGLKNMKVPVILKVIEGDKEIELTRKLVEVDEHGQKVPFTLQHQPKKAGKKTFIVELEAPKSDKQGPIGNRRLERTIDIQENSKINVLLVDGTPRYDYRFLKSLIEREVDENGKKAMELKVLLLDADAGVPAQDPTALREFPSLKELNEHYDVVIFGDCKPNPDDRPGGGPLTNKRLSDLVEFVAGGVKGKAGGGILFVAGTYYNPHAYNYKDSPLAKLLPIRFSPGGERPPEPEFIDQKYRLEWTAAGRQYQMFKFSADEFESKNIWDHKLSQLYWSSRGYKAAPTAEILATHQIQKGHPLIVQQFYGLGRTMFFGFDESWRWRFREDEVRYNNFWIQTIRYLSRLRSTHTDLRLNKQTPYKQGDKPEVTVTFPDASVLQGQEGAAKQKITIGVEFTPKDKNEVEGKPRYFPLVRDATSGGRFVGNDPEALRNPGKYRYFLSDPDVTKNKTQPRPQADAVVELPPGELETLRLNKEDMQDAAKATKGKFYTLDEADKLLLTISPERQQMSTPWPPVLLWSLPICFMLVMGLLTSEWILRKRKHLL